MDSERTHSEHQPQTNKAADSRRRTPWLRSFVHFCATIRRDAWDSIRRWSLARMLTVGAIAVGLVVLFIVIDFPTLTSLRESAESAGRGFMILFWLGYVFFTQFPLPRTVWTVASGILYGPWVGLIIALTALTASAAISLLLVRWLLGDWMAPRLKHPAVAGINYRLRKRGWLAVASLRLIAGVPFSLVNYTAALTSIPFFPFVVATLVGSAPGTVVGVLFGDTLIAGTNPLVIVLLAAIAVVGIGGLILDARMPVQTRTVIKSEV